ncbi:MULTISPECIES: CRISPR-associated endoribonuclease Cas6 [unclassified Archaeoglobus]|jgi:CRISPR-associated endoribonuclease Cas6|uniref:CRISPR-associated endoribonuclease Cas6 n=1 Tax=unclassified Archaeoglobus TaxID=2643606 RepID=UPI0025BEF8CB|nr:MULTISPECIES: CRISPR-associated endoribonuclease Cas6 [unclassified Archaeoglobus]
MRLRVNLTPPEGVAKVDLNYSYYLSSLIYRAIKSADKTLSLELHRPYGPKLFTFSKLFAENFKIDGGRMWIEGSAHFFFSSPKNEMCGKFVEGLLTNPEVNIGDAQFLVTGIEVLREKKIGKKEKFVTLSPITVSTVERQGYSRKSVDLYPSDARFYEVIRKNLVKKYVALHGIEPEDVELSIKPIAVKPKRLRIKNTFHRCSEMVFVAEGSRELLEVGYKTGFGAKNSMGFGMVKVV